MTPDYEAQFRRALFGVYVAYIRAQRPPAVRPARNPQTLAGRWGMPRRVAGGAAFPCTQPTPSRPKADKHARPNLPLLVGHRSSRPMSDLALVGVSVGITLTAGGIVAGLYQTWQHGRRIAALERRVSELEPAARHDRLQRDHTDTGEAFLFGLVSIGRDLEITRTKLDYYARMAQHVRDGGRPDDKPTEWKQGT